MDRPRLTASAGLLRAGLEEVRGRPLACAVALFALGIWVGARYDLILSWALAAIAVVGLALLVALWRRSRGAVALILVLAALAGGFAYANSQVKRAGDVSTFDRTARTLEGVVVTDPRQWADRQSMAVDLTACVNPAAGKRSPARGRIWLACESRQPFERGDLIRFTSVISVPGAPTNPGELTRAPGMRAAGLSASANVDDERLIERLGRARLGVLESTGIAFREHVSSVLRESMPGPYPDAMGALLGSIVFGAKANPLPSEVTDAFRRAGVVHVLVVSGTQISMLFAIVYAPGLLALRLRRRRYGSAAGDRGWVAPMPTHTSLAFVLTLIAIYAVFSEGGRPVARAAIMGAVVAFGLMLRQAPRIADYHALEFDRYTILAIAALALLVVHPEGLSDVGLQLSLAAVAGLVYLGPKLMRPLASLPRWLGLTIGSTTAAQLAVLPVMAWHFGYISPAGFIANLFVIPMAGLLLVSGIAVVALGTVSLPAATLVNYLNAPLLLLAVRFTSAMANLPWATVPVRTTSPWSVAAYYVALIALAALVERWLTPRSAEPSPLRGAAPPPRPAHDQAPPA